MIRSKYLKWKRRYISYSKMRRKTKAKRISLTRALLLLLRKLIDFEAELQKHHSLSFTAPYYRRAATIKQVYEQQSNYFNVSSI